MQIAVTNSLRSIMSSNIRVRVENDIIISEVKSKFDVHAAMELKQKIMDMIPKVGNGFWAHICVSNDEESISSESANVIKDLMNKGWENGCLVGAYVLSSSYVRQQLNQIASDAGALNGTNGRVFDTFEQAYSHVKEILGGVTKREFI
jgi:hypothetical protein